MKDLLTYCFHFTEIIGYPSYGVAIIILTIAIKLVLAPLTVKQVKSMKGMQKLQPKIKELQAKYKNNQQKMQQEMQKLYKEMGINPLAGCLPLLIQMPFLIAIFYALREYPYIDAYQSFLWLPSLGHPDPYYILPALSALSTYVVSMQTSADNSPQAKVMLYGMPVFIGYISLTFPSGLVIYWTISNIFQIIQQYFIFRNEDKEGAK